MARDALHREESCGGHFRSEHQTEEGEAKRDDENFVYAAVWEYKGMDQSRDDQGAAELRVRTPGTAQLQGLRFSDVQH